MGKKILLLTSMIVLVLLLVNVSAITGSLGNSRMILRVEPGEVIERHLLIKNVNEEPISVSLSVSGMLVENIVLVDEEFDLEPGDERKAYFTIYTDEYGAFETKINVAYQPTEGNGVGLAATVIVLSMEEGVELDDDEIEFEELSDETEDENDENLFNLNQGGSVPNEGIIDEKISVSRILFISTFILIVVFIVLVVLATNAGKEKKRGRGKSE
jgi:hypothetical protein